MKATQQKAAQRAATIYTQAATTGTSAYLTRKGIQLPAGVRFVRDLPSASAGFTKEFPPYRAGGAGDECSGRVSRPAIHPGHRRQQVFSARRQDGRRVFVLGDLPADAPAGTGGRSGDRAKRVVERWAGPWWWRFQREICRKLRRSCAPGIRKRRSSSAAMRMRPVAPRPPSRNAGRKGRAVFPPDAINDFNDLHQAR
ncbi:MAG: hypothetical protein IPL99_12435, partial [Candidatus Competibacteraceae bacterium]|nr:hypothetical protein [Candidatus Competibacteraceae bacterium]